MRYELKSDGHEDYSVWNMDTNKKIAEHIVFAGTALNIINQLNWGLLTEDKIESFKVK